MEILWLKIQDFKSFRGKHRIDFRSYGPGLYFMKGENHDEEELGSNGSGKSTIWDALHWCWFGTSVRGTPSTQLVPWSGSGRPLVEFAAKIDGSVIKIRRSHKPNKLTLVRRKKAKDITQIELNDFLGLTSETIQNSIIMGQFSRYFFDLKPREKMNVLTDLLDLDYWTNCGKRANDALSVLKEDQHGLEKKLADREGSIKALQTAAATLQSDLDKAGRKVAVKEIRKETRLLRADLVTLAEQRERLKEEQKEADKKGDEHQEAMNKLSERIDELKDEENELAFSHRKVTDAVKELRDKIKKLEQRKFGGDPYPCPECGQPITDAHRRKERRKIDLELVKQLTEKGELGDLLSKQSHKIDEDVEEYNKQLNLREGCDGDYDRLGKRIRILTAKIHRIEGDIEDNEKEIELTQKETTWIRDRLEENQTKIAEKEKEVKATKKELHEIEAANNQASYWARTFKDIRLFEINDVLTSLQVEINSYLADLGMAGWTVQLEVERTTQRGSVSRGFRVMVDPGKGSKGGAKPWEAWSGGEGQRLRLAGALALSNLILRKFNRTSNIQIWDEKLYWLSGQGEGDMLELLHEIAVQEGKQIWVVDQHNLDYPFDGSIRVIKDSNGSRIVQ